MRIILAAVGKERATTDSRGLSGDENCVLRFTGVLGFALPQFGQAARDDLPRFASAAEQLGADSLWVGDRLLAPVHPTVGYAGTRSMPVQFRTCLDPFTALTAAATVTTTARIGARADGWLALVQANHVNLAMLSGQHRLIDDAARAAGRDPAAIRTHVRINVREGSQVAQVADAVRLLADNRYPDAFVDLIYVATGTDSHLEWVERLLAP